MINSAFSLAFNGSALLSNQKEMKLDRTIYQVTTNRCTSNVTSGFSGDTASLTPNPAWNEKLSGYSITGATLTGSTFMFTNSDVTAEANYETAKNVTTTTDGHGTITASPKSGFIGTQVTLTNTPNANYGFSGYSITGATLTGNKFNLTGSNVTARATFSAQPTAYQGGYTLQTYYNPVSSNPGSTMDENMHYARNFIIPVGNVGGSYTRRYHVAGLANTQGYPIYTGNVNNCIVLGNNRRLSGHITANIHYPSNQANLICVGIDPNYTTYSAGTYTKKIPSQWVSANIISTASCNTFGQGGYTNQNVTFNIDTSNIAGTLFLATSGNNAGSPQGVYVNSFTANLIEMVV